MVGSGAWRRWATAVAAAALVLTACSPGGGDDGGGDGAGQGSGKPATGAPPTEQAKLAVGSDAPNIVVVMADDMRFDDLQFTPFMRKLFERRGVTFENSFSNYPLCCPARASFVTGQLAHNHEVWYHKPPFAYRAFDDSRSIGTSLQENGYQTAFIGKYLNKYGQDKSKVSGKPSYNYVPHGWTDWMAGIQNPGGVGIKGGLHAYYRTAMNINGEPRSHPGEYQTGVFGRYARQLVQKYHDADAPFYIQLNYLAPHKGGPGEPDDPKNVRNRRGNKEKIQTPARPDWVKGRFDSLIDRAQGQPRSGRRSEADVSDKPKFISRLPEPNKEVWDAVRELTRQRAEALFVLDRDVRKTVRKLRRTGEWQDTVLMLTSDNGYYLGDHRRPKGKVHAHEPSFRVPFAITGPGMRDGSSRHDPITTVDVTATIRDLAGGAPEPWPADGASLLDVARQGDRGWRRPAILEGANATKPRESIFGDDDQRRSAGFRTARYKFIRYHDGFTELYDLERDPFELDNVAEKRAYAEVRRELQGVLDDIEDCAGAECRAELPASLATGPRATRKISSAWQAAHERRYGYGR